MKYSDIVWSGFSSFLSDSDTKEALSCLRTGIKLALEPNVKIENAIVKGSYACAEKLVFGFVTKNYLVPNDGNLNRLFEKVFNGNPKGVFKTLKSYGVSNKEIM